MSCMSGGMPAFLPLDRGFICMVGLPTQSAKYPDQNSTNHQTYPFLTRNNVCHYPISNSQPLLHQSARMSGLKAGDSFPEGITFSSVFHHPATPPLVTLTVLEIQYPLTDTTTHRYVPYTEESSGITSCGIPQSYNASKEFANKKVVLFGVPGTLRRPNRCISLHLLSWIEVQSEGLTNAILRCFHTGMLRQASPALHREIG